MNKIEVGMYVRTKEGICKVIEAIPNEDYNFLSTYKNDLNTTIIYHEIIKASHNIIDLIEVGDYVNGHKVYEIKGKCIMVGYKCFKTKFNNEEEYLYQTIYEEDIKTIVTKEMMESMQYKVG